MSNLRKLAVMLIDEDLIGIQLEDRISVPTQRTLTDAGQMLVPCKFARTGSQKYLAKQVFRTQALLDEYKLLPNDVIELHRDEATVFDEASMESFRSSPVVIGHPKDGEGNPIAVTSENSKDLQVGVLEGMPTRDEDTLGGTLVLTAQEAIDALEGGTQELSAGYICDIALVDGKFYQRNVRANHIAIVPKGRAGANCRIADEETSTAELVKARLLADHGIEVADDSDFGQLVVQMADSLDELKADLAVAILDAATQKELVVDFKEAAEKAEISEKKMEVALADAKVAAEQGVIERCEVIENARLIADMRDLGDKSVEQIRLLVVEDQMPEKNFEGKSPEFISAMFEILTDAAKGDTPMSKLLREQESHLVVDAQKPAKDKVVDARSAMIKRSQAQAK